MPALMVFPRAALLLGAAALLHGCGGGSGDASAPDLTRAEIAPVMPCASLLGVRLPRATITGAQAVPAGSYQPPGSASAFANLPAFCRVTATLTPVPGSVSSVELWLPAAGWNGRYLQVGTNGFGGTLAWNTMAPQLQRGFATAATDSGHTSPGGFSSSWYFESPERFPDFAGRSVHELAVAAKQVIAAYYAQPARYAYHSGTSSGGRAGLLAAQRHPRDFDGILAGAAIQHFTRGATQMLFTSRQLAQAGFQGAAGTALLNRVQQAAIAHCDALDGLADGIVGDPRRCTWDPHTLVCAPAQDPTTCLSAAQADAIAASTTTMRDPVTQQALFVGQPLTAQVDWISFIVNPAYSVAVYQMGLNDPGWDGSTFDLHRDLPLVEAALGANDATDPDLSAFQAAGGKLIQYQSWEDGVALPEASVQYYDAVRDASSQGDRARQQDFYRLFMIPGTSHGGTGAGPYNFGQIGQLPVANDAEHDAITALQAWVERGVAPQRFVATKFRNNDPAQGIALQRPLCPYPAQAVYQGSGDANAAGSFACR